MDSGILSNAVRRTAASMKKWKDIILLMLYFDSHTVKISEN